MQTRGGKLKCRQSYKTQTSWRGTKVMHVVLKAHTRWDHNIYRRCWEIGKLDLLKAVRVKLVNNPRWRVLYIDITCCNKPDLLSIICIDLVDHVMTWLRRIFAWYIRMKLFDDIWMSISADDSMTKQSKSCSKISQFTVKVYQRFLSYLSVVLQTTPIAKEPSCGLTLAVAREFDSTMLCVKGFISFALYL